MDWVYYGGGFVLAIVVIGVLVYSYRNRSRDRGSRR